MREFAGLEELLLAKQDLDGMLTPDIILVEATKETVPVVLPAIMKQLRRRAEWLGFRNFSMVNMQHGPFLYVAANVLVPDTDQDGNSYMRTNVCVGPLQFSHGIEEKDAKVVATGSLLPIRLPQLVARIQIKEEA